MFSMSKVTIPRHANLVACNSALQGNSSSSAVAASSTPLVQERSLRNKDLTTLLSTCFLSNVIFPFRSSSPSKYLIIGLYQAEHL